MVYQSQPYVPGRHDLEQFSCGESSLDTWLREQAAQAAIRGTARTWVWVNEDGYRVVAYYALSAHKVAPALVPSRLRGGTAEIPAVLIGRLALDRSLRGEGLGEVLLADALWRIVQASRTVGARLVVVDALAEQVACFYERLGFRRVPGSLLLVQRVSDVAAAVLGDGP